VVQSILLPAAYFVYVLIFELERTGSTSIL